MSFSVDPKQFWENKILTWEEGRYHSSTKDKSLLERMADRSSNALRFRQTITKKLLEPHLAGKHIVELGCGSGLLARDLIALGAASYKGYDISENAISNATKSAKEFGLCDVVTFEVCDVASLPHLEANIIFSLGLLDWLDEVSLAKVFEVGAAAEFLHAISEKRNSPAQFIHRLYVFLAYGWRTGNYVPNYHSIGDIETFANPYFQKSLQVYRDQRLSFGTLISTLPIEGD